jgi:hypothetical protein
MVSKRKAAQPAEEPTPATETTAAPAAPERQPGDEPAETKRNPGPDPHVIEIDPQAGARLLSRHRYYDKALERYAFRDVQIKFDEKPGQAILDKIKEAGFDWDQEDKAWSKKVARDEAIRTRVDAERLFKEVAGMLREAKGLGEAPGKAPF